MAIEPAMWLPLLCAVLALSLGGILKGATGAGAPVVAVPAIALFFGVPAAVVVMMMPNLLSNAWQFWRYRRHLPEGGFAWWFAGAGFGGAILGTQLLAHAPPDFLLHMVAAGVYLFIVFRILRPGWVLPMAAARRAVLPVGVAAGVLQGATGVSAPISITFLNALALPRPVFIAAISLFFFAMTVAQIPALAAYGLLTPPDLLVSMGALLVILASMPLGEALARRFSPAHFNRLILLLLTAIALRITLGAFF